MVLVHTPEHRADFGAERGLEWFVRWRYHRHFKAALTKTVRRLHADEARTDNYSATRPLSNLDDRVGVAKAAQHTNVLEICAGDVEANRRAARGDEQCVVIHRLAALEGDRLRVSIYSR